MYAALWRKLPGPWYVRAVILLALAVGVFLLLMEVVFPAIGPLMPWNDVGVAAAAKVWPDESGVLAGAGLASYSPSLLIASVAMV